jgi:SAM-dependent methyltransferase
VSTRRTIWWLCYDQLVRRVPSPDWAFMNYGYAPLEPTVSGPQLEVGDERDRLCIQLYDHTLDTVPLAGKDVLEVGSGRGGGASYLSRYRRPLSMTGLDFSQQAVDFCNRHRRAPGLSFTRGDALSLPFPDESFDAVINVESSHCYSSMETFVAEVHRVLRPGGSFLFADLRSRRGLDELHAVFAGSPLDLKREVDITANVLTALRLDNDRKLELIQRLIPGPFRRPFRAFAGIKGTMNYDKFENGTLRYVSANLTKSTRRPIPAAHAQ